MKSMSISVILDWIPDKYRIFYKSTGLDQLFRHARMLDDSMEIIDNDFLYLTQESSLSLIGNGIYVSPGSRFSVPKPDQGRDR